MDNNHKAMTEPGDMVERVAYDNVAIEAVQRLIETGKVTLDRDGYLVALPTALAASGVMEPVAWMYGINAYTYQLPDWSPVKALEVPLYATPQAAALAASGADRMREALEACVEAMATVTEGNPMGVGAKWNKCAHGRYGFEGCESCIDNTLEPALERARQALGETQ